jgi:bifunctional ADP-heptose synthase (sugar kinase/adenylyltransferase)
MHVVEILKEIAALGLYSQSEWSEYRRAFNTPPSDCVTTDEPSSGELVRRIRSGCGRELVKLDMAASPKLCRIKELTSRSEQVRTALGVVSGCFDMLHLGHLRGIHYARRVLDGRRPAKLSALLLGDQHIRDKKGPDRPILDINERVALVGALRGIDHVIVLSDSDCLAALRTLRPEVFFKDRADLEQDAVRAEIEVVLNAGGQIEFFPAAAQMLLNTTRIVEMIRTRLAGYHL